MEDSVNDRIRAIFKQSDCKSMRSWGVKIGIAQTSLNSLLTGDTEPKYSTLHKILLVEKNISSEWLMRGVGPMYLQSGDSTTINIQKGGSNNNIASGGASVQGTSVDPDMINRLLNEMQALREQNIKLTNKLLDLQ